MKFLLAAVSILLAMATAAHAEDWAEKYVTSEPTQLREKPDPKSRVIIHLDSGARLQSIPKVSLDGARDMEERLKIRSIWLNWDFDGPLLCSEGWCWVSVADMQLYGGDPNVRLGTPKGYIPQNSIEKVRYEVDLECYLCDDDPDGF